MSGCFYNLAIFSHSKTKNESYVTEKTGCDLVVWIYLTIFVEIHNMINKIPKEDRNKSGIYKIVNIITGDFYIGSTIKFYERFRSHVTSLKSNKSNSLILQNAVNKYGLVNFEFIIIEICDDYINKEIELILQFTPKYNIRTDVFHRGLCSLDSIEKRRKTIKKRYPTGLISPFKGKSHTKESKELMSASSKGYIAWNKDKPGYTFDRKKKKSVKSIDQVTGIEILFNSIKDASEHFNCTIQAIYRCATGSLKTVKGVKFEYIT